MNFKKAFAVIMLAALNIGLCFAQSGTAKHVVERGETLASIAKLYSVSEEEIVKLNPDAAQFVYVGMELVMPDSQKQEPADTVQSGNALVFQTEAMEPSKQVSNTSNAYSFSFWGVSYFAGFENAGEGFYMVGGEGYNTFNYGGWGLNFMLGANYGLVDKDYAGVAFLVGPAYGYALNNNVLVAASLDFFGSYTGTGKKEKTGYSEMFDREATYTTTGDDSFNWGIALMPKLVLKINKVRPWVGVNAMWTKGVDKLSWGFQVGIGFNI